jgi:hypothetical protein
LTSCARTLNPSEADLFYIPFYPDVAVGDERFEKFRDQMSNLVIGLSQGRKEKYLEWEQVTGTSSKWWERNLGRDHLLVSNIGGWKWGDYNFLRDSRVFHITLELPGYLRSDDVSSRVMVVPYPSENPPFVPLREFNGNSAVEIMIDNETRELLLFAAFSLHRGWYQRKRTIQLRNAITQIPDTLPPSLVMQEPFPPNEWQGHMARARFCLCPSGDTPSTRRFFSAVLSGCGIVS